MSDTTKEDRMDGKKVLVTTKHRGVFHGTLAERDGSTVTLTDARNCVYWSQDVRVQSQSTSDAGSTMASK